MEEAKLDIHEYQAKEILTNFGVATPHGAVGQQLAQKWCSDCFAVGAEDAEAYGSVPSFVFDRGNVFQYWRTRLVFAQEHGAGRDVTNKNSPRGL